MIANEKLVIAIILMAGVTFFTRALPFILFSSGDKKPPAIVNYLGAYLPPAIICTIVVYTFTSINLQVWPFAIKEIIAVGVVVSLHLWKANTMLSIFGGTAVYMILTQIVFA